MFMVRVFILLVNDVKGGTGRAANGDHVLLRGIGAAVDSFLAVR